MEKLTFVTDKRVIVISRSFDKFYIDFVRPNTYAQRVETIGELLDFIKAALEADRREEANVGEEVK